MLEEQFRKLKTTCTFTDNRSWKDITINCMGPLTEKTYQLHQGQQLQPRHTFIFSVGAAPSHDAESYFDLPIEPVARFLSKFQFLRQFWTALLTVPCASRISASVNLCSTIPIGPGCRTLITVSTSRSTCLS